MLHELYRGIRVDSAMRGSSVHRISENTSVIRRLRIVRIVPITH